MITTNTMNQSPCPICSQIQDVETSFYKYDWPDHDQPLPAAAASLVIIDVIGKDREKFHLRRCPSCATLYTYQFSSEYFMNGSEDEEVLTRLSHAEAQVYLRQHAQQLETLRQDIDHLQNTAGSLGDYIDRGHPSDADAKDAYTQMEECRQAADKASQRLQAQVQTFRRTCPEILRLWAEVHCHVCQFYLTDKALADLPSEKADTARYVAQTTLEAWQALSKDGDTFIAINTYFLDGYLERLQTEFAQD